MACNYSSEKRSYYLSDYTFNKALSQYWQTKKKKQKTKQSEKILTAYVFYYYLVCQKMLSQISFPLARSEVTINPLIPAEQLSLPNLLAYKACHVFSEK